MRVNGNVEFPEGAQLDNLTIPTVTVLPSVGSPGEIVLMGSSLYVYISGSWVIFRTLTSGAVTELTGWRDIVVAVELKSNNSSSPTWDIFKNGIYAYKFAADSMKEFWANFHINHDYKPGSAIHLHVHWATNAAATGTVRWGFEYTIAKGHQQEVFPNTTTTYVEQNVSSAYTHMVAEMPTGLTSSSFEPDSLILVRIFRDGSHANDTCSAPVFALTIDCHYQADRHATVNKAPNFYA